MGEQHLFDHHIRRIMFRKRAEITIQRAGEFRRRNVADHGDQHILARQIMAGIIAKFDGRHGAYADALMRAERGISVRMRTEGKFLPAALQ